MPLQAHIHSRFLGSLDAQRDAIEQLAEPIARAVEVIVESLMREGKVLVCGQAGSHDSARLFASLLTHQYQQARPGLAAIALDGGAQSLADDGDCSAVFSRQIESLGQAGDVLLAISGTGNAPGVLAALRGAHAKDLRVIALVGGDGGLLAESLNEDDVVICTFAESAALTRELHLRAIHSLCDGIDYLLLGA